MRTTREQFLQWCRAVIQETDQLRQFRKDRVEVLAEHDPVLAKMEQEGCDHLERVARYLKTRLEGGPN